MTGAVVMPFMRHPFRALAGMIFIAGSIGAVEPAAVASNSVPSSDPAGRTALRYAEAMAAGRVAAWADLDLGCLTSRLAKTAADASRDACWKDTLAVHAKLLADQSEEGIFGAQGRGVGFGLLDESHRKADLWRDYPPAVFVSPSAWKRSGAPPPRIKFLKTLPVRVTGLQLSGDRPPVRVSVTLVELAVTYPDPLSAPLALRPGEPWWASGTIRRYGPVRDLVVRVPVVSGLKGAGYPVDQAVLSAGLPDTPMLLGTGGGGPSEIGRTSDRPGEQTGGQELAGGLLLGSTRWWDRASAGSQFATELRDVRGLSPSPERLARMRRLMRLDPDDVELNRLLGQDAYRMLLNAGLAKGQIDGPDEDMRRRLGELYWTIQAPTWRQELTEVAVGHSQAAETLYRATRALEIVVKSGKADLETVRRAGALRRWNNDSEAALEIHEGVLRRLDPKLSRWRAILLTEIAWDRLQWIFWTRRYEHPWLEQARQEAEQALALADEPMDKLVSAEAVLVAEALAVPRDPARIKASLEIVRKWHGELRKVRGLWPHLIANDMVKAFIAESTTVTLPTTARSSEVVDVRIHATPPPQDLLRTWEFDKDRSGAVPQGFSAATGASGWTVQADAEAPTLPHVLAHSAGCSTPDCFDVLLAEATGFAYPDVTVHLRTLSGVVDSGAGIVMVASDRRLSYAVTLDETAGAVAVHRIADGQVTLLDRASVHLTNRPWHLLRVQRINFAHVSKPRLSVFVDGREVVAVTDDAIPNLDRIGLVTKGAVTARFDRLHALDLVSNQPLSAPAAY